VGGGARLPSTECGANLSNNGVCVGTHEAIVCIVDLNEVLRSFPFLNILVQMLQMPCGIWLARRTIGFKSGDTFAAHTYRWARRRAAAHLASARECAESLFVSTHR